MESRGNIINRPVKATIRNKNYSLMDQEETKVSSTMSLKEKKMIEVAEYRRRAIMGNKMEKISIT